MSSICAVSGLIIRTFAPELAKNRDRVPSQTISLAPSGKIRELTAIDCARPGCKNPQIKISTRHNPSREIKPPKTCILRIGGESVIIGPRPQQITLFSRESMALKY